MANASGSIIMDKLEDMSVQFILYILHSSDVDTECLVPKAIEMVPPHMHIELKHALAVPGQGVAPFLLSLDREGEDSGFISRKIDEILDGDDPSEVSYDFDGIWKALSGLHSKMLNHDKLLQSAEDLVSGDPTLEVMAYERLDMIERPDAADVKQVSRVSMSDINDYQVEEWEDDSVRLPTGTIFDKWMVLAPGELGLIFGPPNIGKSSALICIGSGWVMNHEKLFIHFSIEPRQPQMVTKYASCLLNDPSVCIDNFHDGKFLKKLGRTMKGKLVVECHTDEDVSVESLCTYTSRIMKEEPSVQSMELGGILLDYVTPLKLRGENKVNALAQNIIDLRRMASTFKCPVWTAAQPQRSPSKDIRIHSTMLNSAPPVLTMEDIGECWAYSQVVDYLVSLNQTDGEKDEKPFPAVRAHLCKTREPRNQSCMKIRTTSHNFDYSTCTIL